MNDVSMCPIRDYVRSHPKDFQVLPHREIIDLFRKLEKAPNDKIIKEKIIFANLRLVLSLAQEMLGSDLDINDLVQEGYLGLNKAVENFDWRKGTRFSTFARKCIRNHLLLAIGNQGNTIRLPIFCYRRLKKFNAVRERLDQETGREVSIGETVKEMAFGQEKTETVKKSFSALRILSIDKPLAKIEELRLSDTIEDDEETIEPGEDNRSNNIEDYLDYLALKKEIREIINDGVLTQQEKRVLILRFGLGETGTEEGVSHTQPEIGRIMGRRTKQRIQQVEKKALTKLWDNPKVKERLKFFL